jgi:hypothetical protein
MRIAVPHKLPREEVRARLKARSHEIADYVPGGLAEVTTSWENEDRLGLLLRVMGQEITGAITAEDTQLVFEVELPAALSFVRPMIESAIRDNGPKLLK